MLFNFAINTIEEKRSEGRRYTYRICESKRNENDVAYHHSKGQTVGF